jgi:uncharacterized membrane protein YphA (DoxX/SURF4 family)
MADRGLGSPAAGLRVLSVMLGVFMLFMGIGKVSWFMDTSVLASRVTEWRDAGPAAARWYLETFAIPGMPLFARVVPLAELASGIALILGFWTRLAAGLALFMVLNFHFASDVLLHYAYLTNGFGLPVLSALAALMIGGRNLPFSLSK